MNTVNWSLVKAVGISQLKSSALQHGTRSFCLFLSLQMLTSFTCCLEQHFAAQAIMSTLESW